MKNQEVKIEVSTDGKKWEHKGTFLNLEKALLSLTWMQAKNLPHQRISQGNKVLFQYK